jgi:hypothetical protein
MQAYGLWRRGFDIHGSLRLETVVIAKTVVKYRLVTITEIIIITRSHRNLTTPLSSYKADHQSSHESGSAVS